MNTSDAPALAAHTRRTVVDAVRRDPLPALALLGLAVGLVVGCGLGADAARLILLLHDRLAADSCLLPQSL